MTADTIKTVAKNAPPFTLLGIAGISVIAVIGCGQPRVAGPDGVRRTLTELVSDERMARHEFSKREHDLTTELEATRRRIELLKDEATGELAAFEASITAAHEAQGAVRRLLADTARTLEPYLPPPFGSLLGLASAAIAATALADRRVVNKGGSAQGGPDAG